MAGSHALVRGKQGKRLRQLGIALRSPAAHFGFVRAMRSARAVGTAPSTVLSRVKYLGVYLADQMRPVQRRQAILFHHRFLATTFAPDVWKSALTLWTDNGGGLRQSASLRTASLAPMEGEHEIVFQSDGEILGTLTFIFVPGALLEIAVDSVLFIGGVQGPVGARGAIRAAAKANGEIAPTTMLMIIAKALAQALNVPHLVGLPAKLHPARHYAGDRLWFDYDQLWLDAGATLETGGWFKMPPRLREQRPLSETPRSHRARTRRKRERKAGIYADTVDAVARMTLGSKGAGGPSFELDVTPDGQRRLDSPIVGRIDHSTMQVAPA